MFIIVTKLLVKLTQQVDPRSYWIYTNSPQDNARVDAALRTHGFEGGLDRLSAPA